MRSWYKRDWHDQQFRLGDTMNKSTIKNTITIIFAILIVIAVLLYFYRWEEPVVPGLPSYQVHSVISGDTLLITDGTMITFLRIAGIEAPDEGEPFFEESKNYVERLMLNKKVFLKKIDIEMYDDRTNWRKVNIKINDPELEESSYEDLGLKIIKSGNAFAYRFNCAEYPTNKDKYPYYADPYFKQEQEAQKLGFGIWKITNPMEICKLPPKIVVD